MIPFIIVNNHVTVYWEKKLYQKEFSDKEILKIKRKSLKGFTNKFINKMFIDKSKLPEDILSKEVISSKLFKRKEGAFYRKGINISLPKLLLSEYLDNEGTSVIKALDNFWRLCALNPDPIAREDLFKFLKGGKFTITPSGYIVTYRNVNIKREGNLKLLKFISKNWIKVKTKWLKNPQHYEIFELNGNYSLHLNTTIDIYKDIEFSTKIGNLDNLFHNISDFSETIYTDAHTRTFNIKLGEVVSMRREDCDSDPDSSCSRGLHLKSKSFVNGFGSQAIVCLLNPMNVVAVPNYDNNKLRCCEYLPIALTDYDEENKLIEIDTTLFEYDYSKHTLKELQELLKDTDLTEVKKHHFKTLDDLSGMYFKYISKSLENKLKILQYRNIIID